MPKTVQLALLASGGGSTVATILDAISGKRLVDVNPALIITSRKNASVIAKAIERGFDERHIEIIDPRGFSSSERFGDAIVHACTMHGVDTIGQYGWIPKTPENVIAAFPRIINQHPGALDPDHATPERPHPDFGGPGMYGRRVIAAALHFARETGMNWWVEATTHMVVPEFDAGKLVRSEHVPISSTDTVEETQKRLLPIEHRVQIAVLADIAREEKIWTTQRFEPLILPRHYQDLQFAKACAIADYPNG